MRRVIGLIIAGLGAFFIVIAIVLPTWITGQVLKFPLNEYETATLTATNATYFSPSKLTEVSGVNMSAQYTIKGLGSAGNSSTAVWQEFSAVNDTTNHFQIQLMKRQFAFDRRTAQLVPCCGENINGNSSIRQTGVIGYVFPIGTQKQTYQVFDTTTNTTEPFKYSGTDTVHGIQTYKFTEDVAPVKIGFSPLSATDPEYYTIHLVYWVDPTTGALLQVNEHQNLYTINAITSAKTHTLFDADLITTPATVTAIVALDNNGRSKITLLETILPLVMGIVGALLVAGGILLSRKPREDVQSGLAIATYPSPDAADAGQSSAAAAGPGQSSTAAPVGAAYHPSPTAANAVTTPIKPSPRHAARSDAPNAPTVPNAAASDGASSGNASSGSGNAASSAGLLDDPAPEPTAAPLVPGFDHDNESAEGDDPRAR
jgi:hypothetical protein